MGRVYYGWCIVAISIVANMLVVGSTYTAFGLFVLPVSTEYGLSRADMNTAMILLNFAGAAVAPVIGRMLDRYPARRIMTVCALLLGTSFAVIALSRSLWLSAAMLTLPLAAGVNGAATMTMNVLTARWFVAQRGRAMALSVLGLSLGSVVMAPIIGHLIQGFGWRGALMTLAVADTVLLLGLALLVRERPGPGELEGGRAGSAPSSAAAAPEQPKPVGALLRTPQFWSIALGSAVGMAVAQALTITLAPLALGVGLSMAQATALISLTGASAVASKLLLAVVADKVDRVTVLVGLYGLGALLNVALLATQGYVALIACAVVLGITTGSLAPLVYTLLADRFGAASFGTVRGLSAPFSAILGAIAVRFAGEVYDRTGEYDVMFGCFIVAQVLAGLLMFSSRFGRPLAAARAAA
jgi:predicted MFS family arabinose efflux permease